MAVIKYKDKNGNWKTLTETVNVSGDTSGVCVGDEEPVNPNCQVWYDTSHSPTPLAKCKLANGEWVIVAGGTDNPDNAYIGSKEPTESNYTLWIDTSGATPLLKYKNELGGWTVVSGGGSSSGTVNNVDFDVNYTGGWYAKTIAYGAKCDIPFTGMCSKNDVTIGKAIIRIYVDDVYKTTLERDWGDFTVPVGDYLKSGKSGLNNIKITISDKYGNIEPFPFEITTISVSIDSYFGKTEDGSTPESYKPHEGDIDYTYIPTGKVEKTVYFKVDGKLNGTQTVTQSGGSETYTIKEYDDEGNQVLTHGKHTLEVYFDCVIDGQTVETDHLFYEFISYDEGNSKTIIVSEYNADSVKQYSTVVIPWVAYTEGAETTVVTISDNFGFSTTRIVDRTVQEFSYTPEVAKDTVISFSVGGEVIKTIPFSVEEYHFKTSAVTSNLELYLTANGRSNQDTNIPLTKWSYGDIEAVLKDFGFNNANGWLLDDGNTVLRVAGNARVEIPYKIFTSNILSTGKTIEFEFATRDVLNPNATIISCWDGTKGLKITAQEALLKSEQKTVSRQYKENAHTRVSFTIQKTAENRLVSLYINGVESNTVQYISGEGGDDFSQAEPKGISIGSSDCTTDIYCIRIYNSSLTRYQVLDNWIADTQNVDERIAREEKNDVFTDGLIDVNKIHNKNIPYFVITHINNEPVTDYSMFPQAKRKDDEPKKYASGKYVDPLHPERSFTFVNAEIDVQGTSSQHYPRKNYKIKFKNGFTIEGILYTNYQLRETSVPTNVFTFKTDYASSEGVNNVELAMLYDEVNPARTPPQQVEGSNVRQGIEGYPCLMFYSDGTDTYFIGKYNFNNDKGTEEVFGFAEGDESWEILNNNTDRGMWKDDDFSDGKWQDTFEARYPEDNTNIDNLQEFATWLKSTDTTAVDTDEEKQARINKFRNEFSHWVDVDAMLFNYIFTEVFLMVDNRQKNAFPTRYSEDGKWIILPYDFDTAIGINNNGELKFGYWLEDTDMIDGGVVYNGQDSVLYVNMRLAFPEELTAMYRTIRGNAAFNYEAIEKRFAEHQSVWGEAVFNEDSRFKYIDPLISDGTNELKKLQGSKESQRQWWLYNRFRYLDSKYNTGDNATDKISFYAYVKEDLEITPYADIYASANFDSEYVSVRALRGDSDTPLTYTIENPTYTVKGEDAKDQVVAIYSASQLASVGDLSKFKIGWADFTCGTKLNYLKLGDSSIDENGVETYENLHLKTLTIGTLPLLTSLDIRNCSNFTDVVDASGCKNVKTILCEGTKATAVIVPNGGVLETLHLPETITGLTIRNQPSLSEVTVENGNYGNIANLRLEYINCEKAGLDIIALLNGMKQGNEGKVRLFGIEFNLNTAEEIEALYDKFDSFRGIDENNLPVDDAVIYDCIIHCGPIWTTDLLRLQKRYPNVTIDYEYLTSNVYFYVEGELVHTAAVRVGDKCTDPIGTSIPTPTKEPTVDKVYTFVGWDDNLEDITNDRIVDAEFIEATRQYLIKFVSSSDGTVISSRWYDYGTPADKIIIPECTKTGHHYLCDDTIERVTDNAEYTLTEEINTYTITWNFGSRTDTNEYKYGTPAEKVLPPSGYEKGASYTADGITYIVTAWNGISTVTDNATYTATVQGSGSITSRFTKLGAHGVSDTTNYRLSEADWQALLAGTGTVGGGAQSIRCMFYGFDFRKLNEFNNVNISEIEIIITARITAGSLSEVLTHACTDFNTTGSSINVYTSLTNEKAVSHEGKLTNSMSSITGSYANISENQAKLISWANDNLAEFISGYDSNSFGIRFEGLYTELSSLELTVYFTFG